MANERRRAIQPAKSDRKWRRLVRLRTGSLLCFLVCLVGSVSMFIAASSRNKSWLDTAAIVLGLGWVGCMGFPFLFQALLMKHIRRTLQSRDVAGLGGWIEVVLGPYGIDGNNRRSQMCQAEARAALLEQLPLLTEETAPLLRPGDRNTLYRALCKQDAELIAVVLHIVPILSDARALPAVQYLADGKGAASIHPELQSEAQSTLTHLQARLALNSSSQGLLRASQPPPTPPQELLIPAHPTNETDPKELLRADIRK